MAEWGACPVCGRMMLLTARGLVRSHSGCVGAGELPSPTPEDISQELEARQEPFRDYVRARGGFGAWVDEDGHYWHAHFAHGNTVIDAASGASGGVFSVVIDVNASHPPDVCPVCRDFTEWISADV